MKRVLKWIGIVLAVLVVLVGVLHFVGKGRLEKAPEVMTRPVAVPTDAVALVRGEHLVRSVSACFMCHGDNLEGQVFIEGEIGLYVAAPNLTSGQGGVGATLSDADWERAIRHGVGDDGRVLAIMPSNNFQHFSDADLGAVIAYVKSVPSVDNDLGARKIGFPGSILGGFLAFDELAKINHIDHAAVGKEAPPEGATAVYGEYVVNIAMCSECHAANLAGNFTPDTAPMGPNLTPSGELQGWTEADFMTLIRTGMKPTGTQVDNEEMPWEMYNGMTDVELGAVWAYLQTLSPLPNNPE